MHEACARNDCHMEGRLDGGSRLTLGSRGKGDHITASHGSAVVVDDDRQGVVIVHQEVVGVACALQASTTPHTHQAKTDRVTLMPAAQHFQFA